MAPGIKTGGRKKGTPNKPKLSATGTAPEAVVAQPAPPPPPPPAPTPNISRSRAPARARATPPPAVSLTVETWPLTRLVPYIGNPRKNDHAIDRMVAAIREYGFRIPIVARGDGTIVDGHLRYKAACKLKLAEVPVALADDLTDAQIRAFRLLANKSATWADWDIGLLEQELTDLRADGFALPKTGFGAHELASLGLVIDDGDDMADTSEPDPGPRAKPPPKPVICPKCLHAWSA